MIDHTQAFDKAITGESRKQSPFVAFDLVDPDYHLTATRVSDESLYSKKDDATNRGTGQTEEKCATLEVNRWLLDGSFVGMPVSAQQRTGQFGWEGATLCDSDREFSSPPWIEIEFTGVSLIQVMTILFSDKIEDGVAREFKVEFWSQSNLILTKEVTENYDPLYILEGFEAYYPTKIRLTITKWSLPRRRVRVPRFLIGLYEEWTGDNLSYLEVYTESTFSGLSLPYSTCSIEVLDKTHRFDPYAPNNIFKSIEERQSITVKIGTRLDGGEIEYIPAGRFYQQSGHGWEINGIIVKFSLIDIIGMLNERKPDLSDGLPTTLLGWIQCIIKTMGLNFYDQYIVEDDVQNISVTTTQEQINDMMCGDILRYLCMATNTFPKMDPLTGKLWVGKIPMEFGNKITADNMNSPAVISDNAEVADITFNLLDENEVTFMGTNPNANNSVVVTNPFVHTEADARKAMVSCLYEYGGRQFDVTHRGNQTSEVGDLQSVDTQFKTSVSARLMRQQLKLDGGVMRGVTSVLVQSPNDSLYKNKVVLAGSGAWVSPIAGTVKLTIIGGGTGGTGGGAGNILDGDSFDPEDTTGGEGGSGGNVFIIETVAVLNQSFSFSCGAGGSGGAGGAQSGASTHGGNGEPGTAGGHTTFGLFSSANGRAYGSGFMDIQSGAVYAAKGGDNGDSITGTYGCGGTGGKHGRNGARSTREDKDGFSHTYISAYPTPGEAGGPGQAGCVIVEW